MITLALLRQGRLRKIVETDFTLERYPARMRDKVDITGLNPQPVVGSTYDTETLSFSAPTAEEATRFSAYSNVQWMRQLASSPVGIILQRARGKDTVASAKVDLLMDLFQADGVDFNIARNRQLLDTIVPETLTLVQARRIRGD